MNKERILALADIIEKQPHTEISDANGFSMRNFEHDCGSPACIGGWANSLWGNGKEDSSSDACSHLGISSDQAEELFYANIPWAGITPSHAAAVLRHLADTGEVDWRAFAPSVTPPHE